MIAVGTVCLAVGIGVGLIFASYIQSTARQPESARITTPFLWIGFAVVEALAGRSSRGLAHRDEPILVPEGELVGARAVRRPAANGQRGADAADRHQGHRRPAPQQRTVPSPSIPQVAWFAEASAKTPLKAATVTGWLASVFVPSPSCPWSLSPQQRTVPPGTSAQL